MATTKGPLLSLDASGTVAGTMVFSKWKGRNYVRRHAIPANPKTQPQIANRTMMAFLAQSWSDLSAPEQASWEALAASQSISPFDAYVQVNLRAWTQFQFPTQEYNVSDSDLGSLTTFVPVGGVGQISWTATSASPTDNWGLAIGLGTGGAPGVLKTTIAQVAIFDGASHTGVITGLAPGSYYLDAKNFGVHGQLAADPTSAGPIVVT